MPKTFVGRGTGGPRRLSSSAWSLSRTPAAHSQKVSHSRSTAIGSAEKRLPEPRSTSVRRSPITSWARPSRLASAIDMDGTILGTVADRDQDRSQLVAGADVEPAVGADHRAGLEVAGLVELPDDAAAPAAVAGAVEGVHPGLD